MTLSKEDLPWNREAKKTTLAGCTTLCIGVEGKKPKHVDGTSTHMGKGKGSTHEGIPSLLQGLTIVSDYDAEHHSSRPPKHR